MTDITRLNSLQTSVSPRMTGIKRFGIWYSDVEMTSCTSSLRGFEEAEWNWCSYDPGDIAVVHPNASPMDVDSFLTTMNWTNVADEPIRIQHVFEGLSNSINEAASTRRPLTVADQSLPDHLPEVSTLRSLFTSHLDIGAVPKRSFFRLLKNFASDEREREKLEELSSTDGAVDAPRLLFEIRHLRSHRRSYTSMQPRFVARSGKCSPSSALFACRATISLTSSLHCAHASSPSRALRWPTHMKCICVSRSWTTRPSSKHVGVVSEHLSSHHSPSVSRPSLFADPSLLLCSTRSCPSPRRDTEDKHH